MNKVLTDLTFKEWVSFIFDHPAEGPEWHGDPFTDAELNKGLWYMISPGLGEHMLCLDEPAEVRG